MKKFLTLCAFISLVALLPSCRNNSTSTTTVEVAEPVEVVEVQEEVITTTSSVKRQAPVSDKEDLVEAELVEVMDDK